MSSTLPTTLLSKLGVASWEPKEARLRPFFSLPHEEEVENPSLELFFHYAFAMGSTNCDPIVNLLNTGEQNANSVFVYVPSIEEQGDWVQDYTVHCGPENEFFTVVSSREGDYENLTLLPKIVTDRLETLARLPDNWDGDGASSISPDTITKVKLVLREAISVSEDALPMPSIAPGYGGLVVLEWGTASGNELLLDVPPEDEPPGFLLVERDVGGTKTEIDAEFGEEWTVQKVILRFLSN